MVGSKENVRMREGDGWKVGECQDERRRWLQGRRMSG